MPLRGFHGAAGDAGYWAAILYYHGDRTFGNDPDGTSVEWPVDCVLFDRIGYGLGGLWHGLQF
jgi:hypothetical protein